MPDVNVLLHATNLDARQRSTASCWLEEAFDEPAGIGFAWAALLGFLRISTLPRGPLRTPLPLNDALGTVDTWLAHPHARIVDATDGHAALVGRLLMGAGRGGNLVSDAHLAAIAIEHGAILGTFDRDFERFAGLRCELLEAPAVHEP